MGHEACPGYQGAFATLVAKYPDDTVYPRADFRVEWGPIFHRGRLDGTARVLVIGQDPAQHEGIVRRILVGEAGQRVQGFLWKLGIERSYVMINAALYSIYGKGDTATAPIVAYRNEWISEIVACSQIDAVIAFGGQAEAAFNAWKAKLAAPNTAPKLVKVLHPTSDQHGQITTKAMLDNWNKGLTALAGVTPDVARPLVPYGAAFVAGDLVEIPERDVPAGIPSWMRALDAWAIRPNKPGLNPVTPAEKEENRLYKRGHLSITVPPAEVV